MRSDAASVGHEPYEADHVEESLDRYQILKVFWGTVAFVTCAFPIVNMFVRLVPMPPDLVSAMATISTTLVLIIVLYVYTNRRELYAESRPVSAFEENQPNKISTRALTFTIIAMLSFFSYFVLIDVAQVAPSLQNVAVPLPAYVYLLRPSIVLSYSLFFASTAAAFNLLMMKLFMDERTVPVASGPVAEGQFYNR